MQKQIDELNALILATIESTEAGVREFGQQIDGLLRQLEGLAALAPEELQRRRGELKEAGMALDELRMSKISALPEMDAKIDRAQRILDELWMRAPDSITYEVVKGDHLWGISSKTEVYDDPYMWPRLYRANREQIKDPDMIYPSQVLNVPIAIGERPMLSRSSSLDSYSQLRCWRFRPTDDRVRAKAERGSSPGHYSVCDTNPFRLCHLNLTTSIPH